MGLFGKKKKIKNAEPCCLCGNPEVEEKLADGWICLDCLRKSGGVLSDGLKYEDITKEKVIDPTSAAKIFDEAKNGLEFVCYGCKISKDGVSIANKLEILY